MPEASARDRNPLRQAAKVTGCGLTAARDNGGGLLSRGGLAPAQLAAMDAASRAARGTGFMASGSMGPAAFFNAKRSREEPERKALAQFNRLQVAR
jgi:hypothetical protein